MILIPHSPKELANRLAKDLYGKTSDEAVESGRCIDCGENALANCYSVAGRREYRISGLCEKCFDKMLEEE